MFIELISLLIIFWVPPTVVIVSNFIWDLKFWQSSDYQKDRFYYHLEWDFAPSHRRNYRTLIKIILFSALASVMFGIFPLELHLLAVLLIYVFWSSEMLEVLEKISQKKVPEVRVTPRNTVILALIVTILTIIPVVVGIDIFTAQGISLDSISNFSLGFIEVGGVQIVPSVYLFLIFSSLIALSYDLGSPLFVTMGVYLTSPFGWLNKLYWAWKAEQLLERQRNLLVVAVSGSYGKTTTKNLIAHLLRNEFRTVVTPVTETNLLAVSKFVVENVKLDTQILIVDVNAYKSGDVAEIGKLLKPHLAILTGVDQNHVGLFGSLETTLMAKAEILKYLRIGGTAVMNIDDELVNQIVLESNSKEILYSFNPEPRALNSRENKLEVDHYIIKTVSDGDQTRLDLRRNNSELVFTIPNGDIGELFGHSITAAVIVATELGIQAEDINSYLQEFAAFHPEINLLAGDNESQLLVASKSDNLKQFEYLLMQLQNRPKGTRILATSGLKGLGNHRIDVYMHYRKLLLESADVIISYDSTLINLLKIEHPESIVHVDHPEDMLYQLRARLESGDTIAIHGDIDRHIVEKLRK